jgi:hypothetical protein
MKPFLHGKKVLDVEPLRAPKPHSGFPVANLVHGTESGPSLEVIKEGDKVVRLIVVCCCGERMEIECLYPAGL